MGTFHYTPLRKYTYLLHRVQERIPLVQVRSIWSNFYLPPSITFGADTPPKKTRSLTMNNIYTYIPPSIYKAYII
jgi:hypothetical protein